MRKYLIKTISIIVVIAFWGCSGPNTPEDTVKNFFLALGSGNKNFIKKYVHEDFLQGIEAMDKKTLVQLRDLGKLMKISTLETEIDGRTATVTIQITFRGRSQKEQLELVYEDGRWLLTEGFFIAF